MWNEGLEIEEINIPNIYEHFQRSETNINFDSAYEMTQLSQVTDFKIGFNRSVNKLKRLTSLRNLSAILTQQLENVNNGDASGAEDIIKAVNNLESSESENGKNYVGDYYDEIMNEQGKKKQGIPTGFTKLDYLIGGGLGKGELIIVAGRPGMGKSAFATNVAMNVVKHEGVVCHFSLEMSIAEIGWRIISGESEMALEDYALADTSVANRILETREMITDTKHYRYVLYDKKYTLSDIILTSKKVKKREKRLDLIVIDYVGLIENPGKKSNNASRQEEISAISRKIKNLAKELECCIILVAQLNRESEKRSTHEPMLSDLRESGALEQDADIVIFPYRPSVYDQSIPENQAMLIVPKNRSGNTGVIELNWFGHLTKFKNAANQYQTNYSQSRGYEED
jgi:replicative DNA helicase